MRYLIVLIGILLVGVLFFAHVTWSQERVCTLRESATPVMLYSLACVEMVVQNTDGIITIVEQSRQNVPIPESTYVELLNASNSERAVQCPAGPWNLFALIGGLLNPAIVDTATDCSFTDSTQDSYVYIRIVDPVEGPQLHAIDKRQHTPVKQGRQIRAFVPSPPGLNITNGEVRR